MAVSLLVVFFLTLFLFFFLCFKKSSKKVKWENMKRDEFDEKFEKYARAKRSADFDPMAEIYSSIRNGELCEYSCVVSMSYITKRILESFLTFL